jgi:hypothetical protein
MNKKVVIIGVILLLIILIGIYLLAQAPTKGYSDNPSDWMEKGEINIDLATQGKGHIDEIGQQYRDGDISTVFEIESYYKGNQFFEEAVKDGKVKMRITNDMTPNDGIIEGFMTEKYADGKWIVDIFVDSDWKEQVGLSNIYWGVMYAQEKKFVFTEISRGIYHDQIIDDSDRLFEDARIRTFGVIVGDLTKGDTSGKTLMKLI